jgi:hypothetical protein
LFSIAGACLQAPAAAVPPVAAARQSPNLLAMAKMRRNESKSVLAQQRAEVRRGAYGKQHVGDDAGSGAARQAMRERVQRMQEVSRARERADELSREPIVRLVEHLTLDTFRLAVEWLRLPRRLLEVALRRDRHQPA